MFDQNTLKQLENNYSPVDFSSKPEQKKKGRGGFLTSLISELGGSGGALGGASAGAALGSVVPGIGTAIGGLIGAGVGGFAGGTSGRLVENKVRDDEFRVKDALKEGAFSGVAGAGPIKLAKAGSGAIKGAFSSGVREGAEESLDKSIFNKITGGKVDAAGKRLTEQGSGLKADKNVGGMAGLDEQSQFMTKYTGTPRQQRVSMEKDMKDLSGQVDDVLTKTPIPINGASVGQRLKTAAEDLTDERYLDIDLNNPSVTKIIDRYSEKFGKVQDAKGVNDIVKTLNKTATRAQNKLMNPNAGPLTAQESAALALKRAGDDVLSDIPEIAPLKKNMAQIFEVTPQVAAQAEKGLSSPFLGGVKVKTPTQALNYTQSKAGALLQGATGGPPTSGGPGIVGLGSRILTGRGIDNATSQNIGMGIDPTQENEDQQAAIGGLGAGELGTDTPTEDDSPFAVQNVEANIKSILAQGGKQKDVADYLSNVKMYQALTQESGGQKALNSTASGVIADTKTGLASLDALSGKISKSGANNPLLGQIRSKNPFDTEAQGLQASVATAKQIVGKALEGGVLRKEDESKYAKLLPTMGDTDATAQYKIDELTKLITGRLQEYQRNISGGSGGTDLDALGL